MPNHPEIRGQFRANAPSFVMSIACVAAALFSPTAQVLGMILVTVAYFAYAYWPEISDNIPQARRTRARWVAAVVGVMVVAGIWATRFLPDQASAVPAPTASATPAVGITLDLIRADANDLASCDSPIVEPGMSGSLLVIVAAVKNSGPPSVVEYSPLTITLVTGETLEIRRQERIPVGMKFKNARTGQIIEYSGEDALYNTTFTPVASGARLPGIFMWVVEDVPYTTLLLPKTRYCMDYRDVFENEKTACMNARGEQMSPEEVGARIPGLRDVPRTP